MSFQDLEKRRPSTIHSRDGSQQSSSSSQALAAGIFQINTAVSTFRRQVEALGTSKDTPDHRQKLHTTRQRIGQLVKETSTKLKALSDVDHLETDTNKKVEHAKLARDFQAILKDFQKVQQLAAERETAYAPLVSKSVLPSRSGSDDPNTSLDTNQENQGLLREYKRQEILLLENEVVFNEAIIEERDQGIRDIQEQIGEVNEIFKDLAVLVHEQGVMIDDIDSNIQSSHTVTVQAKTQLAKASKSVKSRSSWSCWLLIIVLIIVIIVVIVLII
ncbi:hypothetical protein AMTRI_Chr06g169730 [Amborella trichopoda]